MRHCFFPAVFLTACSLSHANGGGSRNGLLEMSLEQLVNLEVNTASRTNEQYFTTPAAISILTAEQIRSMHAESLTDLIARLPGAQVFQLSRHAVSVRNDAQFYISSLLLLVDGHPYYSPFTDGPWWETFPIPLREIERIELVRGGGGSTWGLNSTGGVLNIITRQPQDNQSATADLRLTSPGAGEVYAAGNAGSPGRPVRVSAQHQEHLGFIDGDHWSKDSATFAAGMETGAWRHQLHLNGARLKAREYTFVDITSPPGPLADTLEESLSLGTHSERRTRHGVFSLNLGFGQNRADIGVIGQRGNKYQENRLEVRWEQSAAFGLDKGLILADCSDYAMDTPLSGQFHFQPGRGHLRGCSLSATAFATLKPTLSLQAGVRGEHHDC